MTSVSPSSGQGGTIVTVQGNRLRGGAASVVSATLAGYAAAVSSESDSTVVLRAGVGPAAGVAGHVVLTAASQLSGEAVFAEAARRTLEYTQTESTRPGGGLYCEEGS